MTAYIIVETTTQRGGHGEPLIYNKSLVELKCYLRKEAAESNLERVKRTYSAYNLSIQELIVN